MLNEIEYSTISNNVINKYTEILGFFNPFGAIVTETKPVQIYNEAVRYFFDGEDLPNGIFIGNRLKEPKNRERISQDILLNYLESLLTCYH